MLAVNIKAEDGFEPVYRHEGDAGADLRACIPEDVTIMPGESAWVGTGVRMEIPPAHVGLQFPRSGLGERRERNRLRVPWRGQGEAAEPRQGAVHRASRGQGLPVGYSPLLKVPVLEYRG